jgi:integrase/recombinase XerD
LATARAASERDWLAILVAFWHGLRASELIGLTRESISDGYITVQRLKGSLKTIQPLVCDSEPLLSERKALEKAASMAEEGKPLFDFSRQHFWRIVRKHAKAAGLAGHKRHPHMLKHSIAMQTIKQAGIENVRQYLGHKSISSTGAYLRVNDEAASAAVAAAATGKSQ